MASIIRIKRSSTAGNPSTLGAGELAYSAYAGAGGNRLYIGIGSETAGNAANHYVIGGTYYTGLIDASTAGTLTTNASSIPVLSSTGTIDKWLVGNTQLTGNTLSTTNTNGNLVLNPNGTGMVQIAGTWTLPRSAGTNTYVLTTNGTDTASWQPTVATLALAAGGGTTSNVNLLNQTLTVSGGNGITTSVSGQTITISSIGAGGYTSTATGGTTTTLTSSSSANQFFTGTTTQTVKLPDTSTLTLGQEFIVSNNSTGALALQTSAGGSIVSVPGGSQATFTVASTATQTWVYEFTGNNSQTGTGSFVLSNSPTLVTPTLGVATATSINGLTITSTTGTLTLANGKTLTANNTLTFTGTDSSSVNFAAGGTVAYTGTGLQQFASTTSAQLAGVLSDETGSGSVVFGTSPTIGTPTISGGTHTGITGLGIRDTSAAYDVTVAATSSVALTAGRTLTVDVQNSARTIALGGNISLGGALTTGGAFTISGAYGVTLTATNTTSVTLPTSGTLATLAGSETLTNKTIGSGSTWNGNTLAVAYGGTGTTNGSITGTGALAFTAGGSNNNVNLVPTGTGTVDVANARITSVGTPTQATDAANKSYVDGLKSGLDVKYPVRLATTGSNLSVTASGTQAGKTLTNSGTQAALVIDSVPAVVGDRVLIKDQTTSKDNGIYVVTNIGSVSTNWVLTRATDFDGTTTNNYNGTVVAGAFVFVEQGTQNANNGYVVTEAVNDVPTLVVDTDAMVFVQFSGAGEITAGGGLTKTGNTIDVIGTSNRILVNADSIDISPSYVGQTSITTLGTVSTGTWQGTVVGPTYGGTGVNNGSNTITLAGNVSLAGAFTTSGAYGITLTATGSTSVTLPTTGTLATLAGSEALSNKTITSSSFSGTTISASGLITLTNATDASALGTAGVVMSGGLSVAKAIYVGTNITGAGAATSTLDGFQIDGGSY